MGPWTSLLRQTAVYGHFYGPGDVAQAEHSDPTCRANQIDGSASSYLSKTTGKYARFSRAPHELLP
ncbi:hypothetical protein DMR_41700 [Solidesulfovibrio magneticus RS-1]|uniref:Uncharacterized protein n=1 Tax=Solidesulfovibrio magneticus (strain ATCC 700980 / DSM 13731 / RS-1) TaxID=573370 RepID=C4XPW1_SOLM1|nr:hypothetical protein DMR_41700 [Solidesulfovibrio magneticus RS-1]